MVGGGCSNEIESSAPSSHHSLPSLIVLFHFRPQAALQPVAGGVKPAQASVRSSPQCVQPSLVWLAGA